jgi:hypothetical protein
MQTVVYRITGVSPILQHNPQGMKRSNDGMTAAKKTYLSGEDEAEQGTYRNARRELIVPTIAFRSALLEACKGRKIGKVGAKTVVAGSVFPVETEAVLLDVKNEKPITKYEIHTCRAVVNDAGILRSRPMISNWCCDLPLEVDDEMLPNWESVVGELLNIAGKIVGVMDWRPEKLGTFGRFRAELAGGKKRRK